MGEADGTSRAEQLSRAAAAITAADYLLIAAGAGMGVDSGLPDFRGPQGFWRAYPAFEKLGLRFEEIANARWFDEDPHLAWGFYGHRLNLYRATRPHEGFSILMKWARQRPGRYYVFTSNVDGQFQAAGFPPGRIVECHGSIHYLQCATPCGDDVWFNDCTIAVDESTCRASDPLPTCRRCGGVARPNVMMFGYDVKWAGPRTLEQAECYAKWLDAALDARSFVIIEIGAGTAVQTVRANSEIQAGMANGTLIRINPREPEVPEGERVIGLPMSSLDALRAILTIATS